MMRHRCIPLTCSEEGYREFAEIICASLPDEVFCESAPVEASFCLLTCQHPEKRGK